MRLSTDEKIELAKKIEGKLVGITLSEWNKWQSYVKVYGLKKGLEFAKVLKDSPSLRPGQKQSYRTILEVMRRYQKELNQLSKEELAEVLGYISRWIVARRVRL